MTGSGPQHRVMAVLGPTNTGKTHLAIERMCAHSSGVIGFPLRLLAREVYDRVVAIKGEAQVALITGEERIVPPDARWYCATVEAMPLVRPAIGKAKPQDFAFVAIDEAQLAADPERGHIFTDRLLHARGREETMILGSQSLAPIIVSLLPEAEIVGRPRFSTLSYAGMGKLSRLPPRSAIVAFSVEQVYAIAEMLRRFRGGAAVVMGALSPRTRNAQVAMYQAGEVDYLVATDAIGMGLNMDVGHVAFGALSKFDGRRHRRLTPAEMAQIAGRAGRHHRDGTFGTLTGAEAMTDAEIMAIEDHRFAPLERLYWRNGDPDFASLGALIASLEEPPGLPGLAAAPEAIDLKVLKRLADDSMLGTGVRGPRQVQRFWDLCRLPDFQSVGAEHHAGFIARLWRDLASGDGRLGSDYVARKIADLDNLQGDIDTLSGRLAAIRSWAYIAERPDWVLAREEMGARAKAVETRLSDALHSRLMQRFVDRRTAILVRQMGQDASLLPVALADDGTVLVDGEAIGTLQGLRFRLSADARHGEHKLLAAAAEKHLPRLLADQARAMAGDPLTAFAIVRLDDGRPALHWRGQPVASLAKGKAWLSPQLVPDRALDMMAQPAREALIAQMKTRLTALIARHLGPLLRLEQASRDAAIPVAARALFIRLVEQGGFVARDHVADMIDALDPAARRLLRKHRLELGNLALFLPHMVRHTSLALWQMLASLQGMDTPRPVPDGLPARVPLAGKQPCPWPYLALGNQALRLDLAERLLRAAHEQRLKQGAAIKDTAKPAGFTISDDQALSMGLTIESHHRLLRMAGFAPLPLPQAANDAAAPPQTWRWRGRRGADARKAMPRRKAASPPVPVRPAPRPENAFAVLADWPGLS